jgi:hypothetical protein
VLLLCLRQQSPKEGDCWRKQRRGTCRSSTCTLSMTRMCLYCCPLLSASFSWRVIMVCWMAQQVVCAIGPHVSIPILVRLYECHNTVHDIVLAPASTSELQSLFDSKQCCPCHLLKALSIHVHHIMYILVHCIRDYLLSSPPLRPSSPAICQPSSILSYST